MNSQKGISLIEIMISLLLTSVVTSLMLKHYVTVKKQYNAIHSQLMKAYDLALISDLLQNSIRHAGFSPCVGINALKTADDRHHYTQLKTLNTDFGPKHALWIGRMKEEFAFVSRVLSSKLLKIDGFSGLDVHKTIMIADCYHAEVNTITQIRRQEGKMLLVLQSPLKFQYENPIYVGEWLEEQFYIAQNTRGKKALFYGNHHGEELSDKIHALRAHSQAKLVHVYLGIDDKEIVLETATRMP